MSKLSEGGVQLDHQGQGSHHVGEAVAWFFRLAHGLRSDEVPACYPRHWSQLHHRQSAPRRFWSPTVRPY